jgi:hypothetical protein
MEFQKPIDISVQKFCFVAYYHITLAFPLLMPEAVLSCFFRSDIQSGGRPHPVMRNLHPSTVRKPSQALLFPLLSFKGTNSYIA